MSDAQAVVAALKQWKIGGATLGTPIMSKSSFGEPHERNYSLLNSRINLFAQHEDQTFGINLGFTDNGSSSTEQKVRRWFFHSDGVETIRYGDTIALGNGGEPSFIRNTHRTTGVDLDWADQAIREWQLLGGTIGQPVRTGDTVALFNAHNQSCLVHFKRTVGGEFGWPGSKTWLEQVKLGDVVTAVTAAIQILKAL